MRTLRARGGLVSDMFLISGSPACVRRLDVTCIGGPRARAGVARARAAQIGSLRAFLVNESSLGCGRRADQNVGRDLRAARRHSQERADALGREYFCRASAVRKRCLVESFS